MSNIQVELNQIITDRQGANIVLKWEGETPVFLTLRDVMVQCIEAFPDELSKKLTPVERRLYSVLANRIAMAKNKISIDPKYIETIKTICSYVYASPVTIGEFEKIFNSLLGITDMEDLPGFEEIEDTVPADNQGNSPTEILNTEEHGQEQTEASKEAYA